MKVFSEKKSSKPLNETTWSMAPTPIDADRAAAAGGVVGLAHDGGDADGLEGVVEAVAGELGLEGREVVGLAGVGGAELLGLLELVVDAGRRRR